jgi:hypothetical protein
MALPHQHTSRIGLEKKSVMALITNLAPHLFWGVVILLLIWMIGPTNIREAFANVRKVEFGGFKVELREEVEAAAQARKIDMPPELRNQVVRRLERTHLFLVGARLLWIDDTPSNNLIEIGILRRLGIIIDLARSSEDAEQRLENSVYDLVLSDMRREGDEKAGEKFLRKIESSRLVPPLIFYVGKQCDVPATAFGLTTRPDELLNLVADALERQRG